jgi:RNA polymerase sigma-70 factor (ECF subfamily)
MAEAFEAHRGHLRSVAYRMLGSLGDADDALQDAWVRVTRADPDGIDNMGGWLTTVVARVCLNMLRSRATRREEPLEFHVPDPVVTLDGTGDPEREAEVAEGVGLALLVVLETLPPGERLAFVLHDLFGVPFDEIGRILERSPAAARQLASRGRRRVRGATPPPDADLGRQREVVEAFFAAARGGDFDRLVAVLHPDAVLRADAGARSGASMVIRGAAEIAGRALMFAGPSRVVHDALVNDAAGAVITVNGHAVAVMAFTVADGKVVAIDTLSDPARLTALPLPPLAPAH